MGFYIMAESGSTLIPITTEISPGPIGEDALPPSGLRLMLFAKKLSMSPGPAGYHANPGATI